MSSAFHVVTRCIGANKRRWFVCHIAGRILRQSLLMRFLIAFLTVMFCIIVSIYHMLTDNPLQLNNDISMNTDLSWNVPKCNVFFGKRSVLLGSLRPCKDFPSDKDALNIYVSIHSTPKEFSARDNLRRLFRETELVAKDMNIKLSLRHQFVLGRTSHDYLSAIEKEFIQFGDVLIGDFKDSYRNLTLKMMFGILYAYEFCQNAHYVLKLDDDTFYNPVNLIALLRESPRERMYMGMSNANRLPRRNERNKFYISPKVYPGKLFPPFVFGGSTILTMDSIKHLNSSHFRVPCLPLEDTYMGLLMEGYADVTWIAMWSRTETMTRPLTDCELSSTVFVESKKYLQYYVENKMRLQKPTNCHLLTRVWDNLV